MAASLGLKRSCGASFAARVLPRFYKRRGTACANSTNQRKAKVAEKPASLADAAYAGLYHDPWYGNVTVSRSLHGLRIRFDETPGMEGPLTHVTGNEFRTHWADRNAEDAYVEFSIAAGQVVAVHMHPVSPLADLSFDYRDLSFIPVGAH